MTSALSILTGSAQIGMIILVAGLQVQGWMAALNLDISVWQRIFSQAIASFCSDSAGVHIPRGASAE